MNKRRCGGARVLAAGLAMLLAGCTAERIVQDTQATLVWTGLRSGSDLDAAARWQLPPGTRVTVRELAPAAVDDWRAAAQAGIDAVLLPRVEAPLGLELLVAWPAGQSADAAPVSGWYGWLPQHWLPPLRDTLDVHLLLVDPAAERVLQRARLRVEPHWFSRGSARPREIERAFQDYAMRLTRNG